MVVVIVGVEVVNVACLRMTFRQIHGSKYERGMFKTQRGNWEMTKVESTWYSSHFAEDTVTQPFRYCCKSMG